MPPPASGCEACAAQDTVIVEQARVLGEQVRAIEELRAGVAWLRSEVAELRRRLGRNSVVQLSLGAVTGPSRLARRPENLGDRDGHAQLLQDAVSWKDRKSTRLNS